MKLVFLSDLWIPFPGGAEKLMWNIANQMRLRGHGVVVIHSYFKAHDSEGIKTAFHDIGVRGQSERRHQEGWEIISADIRATQPDVIFTHGFFASEFERELSGLDVPFVQVVHNGRRMNFASLAIYNSDYTRTALEAKNPRGALTDMTLIPPAFEDVDARVFRKVIREEYWNYIGFIKPIPHKGIEFVYALAEAMRDRKFLILRGEWILLEDIRRVPNVEFMESVDDIRQFYRRVRIMLVPSLSEDAGTVAQESAINEIPCISSDVMGLKETNAAGIRLPLDVSMWVETIRDLDDPMRYARVVQNQTAHLAAFQWPEKFNELDARIRQGFK